MSRIQDEARTLVKWLEAQEHPERPVPAAQLQALIDAVNLCDSDSSGYDAEYRAAAEERWGSDGSIEIDADAVVSAGDDPGAYVQAWVWVYDSDAGIERLPEDDEDEEGIEGTER